MASSMTGFGRFEAENDNAKISVEIRSVNHRYLDLNLKLNHRLLVFENKIRRIVSDKLKRGKVDINISYHTLSGSGEDILYNEALASTYLARISKIAGDFGLVNDLTASRLASLRDVLTLDEVPVDEDELFDLVEKALNNSLELLCTHRLEEGGRLKEDMINKLSVLSEHVSVIEKKAPQIIEDYKNRLKDKVCEILSNKEIDEQRIAMEVVIYADKICVDEELVRLRSHIDAFNNTLNANGEIGRKLDFIAQEMNREANTILSKTTDPEVSDVGIEIKTLIEKIREQVQNIE